jgi:hypothetical protein
MRKSLTGQYKFKPDASQVYVVGSKATERPNLEKQASCYSGVRTRRIWSGGKGMVRRKADSD